LEGISMNSTDVEREKEKIRKKRDMAMYKARARRDTTKRIRRYMKPYNRQLKDLEKEDIYD